MATYVFTLQGTIDTTIDATDFINFSGLSFNSALFVGSYNDTTHVETFIGGNKSTGNAPHNTKFLDATHYSLDGGGSTLLDSTHPSNTQCPLRINFSHPSAVSVINHIVFAYDGADVLNPPVGVIFKAGEKGDTVWTEAGGQAAAVTMGDRSVNTSHDFYLFISATPTSVGLKTSFVIRDELIYS